MRCDDAIELFSQYREGDLSPGRRRELEAHLAGCARCRQQFAAVEAALAWLHDLQAEPTPPGLVSAVRARLRPTAGRRPATKPALYPLAGGEQACGLPAFGGRGPAVERAQAVLLRWALPVGAAAMLVVVAFGILHVTSRRTPVMRAPAPALTAATPRALLGRPEVTAPAAVPPAATAGAESQAATPVLPPPAVGAGLPTGPRAGTEPRPYRRPQAAVPSAAPPPAPREAERESMAARPQALPPVPPPPPTGAAERGGTPGHRELAFRSAEAARPAPEKAEQPPLAVPGRAAAQEQVPGALLDERTRTRAERASAAAPAPADGFMGRVASARAGGAASVRVRAQATSTQVAARNLTLQLKPDEEVDNAQVALRGADARAPEVVVWQGRLEKSVANSVDVQLPPEGAYRQEPVRRLRLVIRGPQLNSQAYYVFAPSGSGEKSQVPPPLAAGRHPATKPALYPPVAGPAATKGKRREAAATWDEVLQRMARDRGVYVLVPAGFPTNRRASLGARPVESALRQMGYELRADSGALVIEAQAERAPHPTRARRSR